MTMAHDKQFTLYTAAHSPFGKEVILALHELALTYEPIYIDFKKAEQKSEEFTKYNPNGRVPVIVDHQNNELALWESSAIIMYLVDRYDPEHKISATGNDTYVLNQWLLFQATGQAGPFYNWYHYALQSPEKVPSVLERYKSEVVRVLGVLEKVLSKQEWLVGGKFTVADLVFVPWNPLGIPREFLDPAEFDVETKFPALYKWHNAIVSRPAVKEAMKLE